MRGSRGRRRRAPPREDARSARGPSAARAQPAAGRAAAQRVPRRPRRSRPAVRKRLQGRQRARGEVEAVDVELLRGRPLGERRCERLQQRRLAAAARPKTSRLPSVSRSSRRGFAVAARARRAGRAPRPPSDRARHVTDCYLSPGGRRAVRPARAGAATAARGGSRPRLALASSHAPTRSCRSVACGRRTGAASTAGGRVRRRRGGTPRTAGSRRLRRDGGGLAGEGGLELGRAPARRGRSARKPGRASPRAMRAASGTPMTSALSAGLVHPERDPQVRVCADLLADDTARPLRREHQMNAERSGRGARRR